MAYASPYYDPAKAHEYYMKHRKLKGNRSTKGMSDEQKETLKYGKEQLYQEHKQRLSKITTDANEKRTALNEEHKEWKGEMREWKKQRLQEIREKASAKKEEIRQQTEQKIEAIRERLKNMSPEEKAVFKEQLNTVITNLRTGKKRSTETITASAKAEQQGVNEYYSGKVEFANQRHKEAMQGVSDKAKKKREQESVDYNKALDDWYEQVRKKGQ